MLLPLLLVIAEVTRKRLLAPRALRRVGDGGPGADALVHAGVLEEQCEGAVAAHGVSRDGDAAGVELLEVLKDELGQLGGEVRLHLVVLLPGVADGVNVKGRGAAKVVAVVLAGQVGAAGRGVREQQGEAQRRGVRVQEALFRHVLGRAGQAGEVDEQGSGLGGGGARRDEEVEVHGRASRGGLVGELEEAAAKGGDGAVGGEGHCGWMESLWD